MAVHLTEYDHFVILINYDQFDIKIQKNSCYIMSRIFLMCDHIKIMFMNDLFNGPCNVPGNSLGPNIKGIGIS